MRTLVQCLLFILAMAAVSLILAAVLSFFASAFNDTALKWIYGFQPVNGWMIYTSGFV